MQYKHILVTGGAGFVGSHICIKLKKEYSNISVYALDNLVRKGSELNVPRLEESGVTFIRGDVRNKDDLDFRKIDLIIECSADPSVMAGVDGSPEYIIDTNLVGAINCFELARKNNADIIFLSTSRVYPVTTINNLKYTETDTRFELSDQLNISGVSERGINEKFPLDGTRSIYGATKLCAELLLQEYIKNYNIHGVINRFGVISGPWQMGKIDQGVIVYWMVHHIYNKPLSYIGFGGKGKQVRDVIHIDDVFLLLKKQLQDLKKCNGEIYNVGGGYSRSISLLELTKYCQEIAGIIVPIQHIQETRPGDIKLYISDNSKIESDLEWKPQKAVRQCLEDINDWIIENKKTLEHILI